MKRTRFYLFGAAGALGVAAMLATASARAQDDAGGPLSEIGVSANVALVSDYRFRGVSFSDEDFALQGGFDLDYKGFYVGAWGSSIDGVGSSELELDLYGGYTASIGDFTYDVGVLVFFFPGAFGEDVNYVEPYASVGYDFGGFSTTVGVAYAPEQGANTTDNDNIYIYGDLEVPLEEYIDLPLTFAAHLGYEDGAFGNDNKVDWIVGLTANFLKLDWSVQYIDTNAEDEFGSLADATVVFSLGASF